MRLKISLKVPPSSQIPFNYSYSIASAIYRTIERASPKLSLDLHLQNVPKFFTFSKLMIPKKKIIGDKLLIESNEVYFFFSSIKSEIGVKLAEGLFFNPEIKLGPLKLILSQIEVLEEKKITENEKFITLSPIYVSKSENGKALDLNPTQKEFYDVLRQNLIKKYAILHGKKPENDEIEFKLISFKPKKIWMKIEKEGIPFHCAEMVFEAHGNPELLEIGYKAGFGAKNSLGFGMVKAV